MIFHSADLEEKWQLTHLISFATTQKDRCTEQHKAADDCQKPSSWKGLMILGFLDAAAVTTQLSPSAIFTRPVKVGAFQCQ